MKKVLWSLTFLFALMLTGCANAGEDKTVESGSQVELDGSQSTGSFGAKIKSYRWKQIKGVKVKLSNKKSSKVTFTAPVVDKNTKLVFKLTVRDVRGFTSYDKVAVIVKQKAEVINGYKLPPEPDPKINNSTLLGVDSNNNGIRDDVERFIVKKYKDKDKAVTEIGFQVARAYQKILKNPLNTEENHKALSDSIDCSSYFEVAAEYFGDKKLINNDFGEDFENVILNTKSRVKAYLEYDRQLSGGVYRITPYSQSKSKCSKEVLDLVGGIK